MQQATFKAATGRKCPEYWFNVFIKIYFVLHFGQIFSSALVGDSLWSMTTACYGSDLECSTFIVHCNSNHIIVVGSMEYAIKETWPCVFGVSDCQRLEKTCCTFDIDDKKIPFHDADVVATHRLCSGRQQCQVEVPRIVEGASVSNYGVMYYKCMEGKKIVDMCSKGIHRGKDLYLMFDGNVYVKSSYSERGSFDCTCKVISSDCSSRILFSVSDIRMLQPDNNFHQGCSRSTLHIANKTITCSANSSTGTYPSNGNDAINSVSYTSTVSLRNLFLASRFDIPEFVLLSASVQDTNSDIFLACNVDNSELQSTSACITIGKSTPTNDKSGSSATPKIPQNLQHTTWSTNTSRSFDLLHGGHNAEGPTLEINTAKGNNDKAVSSQSTLDWMTVDYSPHENIPNVHIRSQSTRANEMDFNNLVGEPTSMNIVKRTLIPETNVSTSKHTKGQRSTTHSIKENSKTSQDFVNTFSFSTFLMDTNVHKTSDNSEHKISTSRLTLKRPEATFGAVQQENSTSIFSKGINTKSPPYTISWSASQVNTSPVLTTRKIPLFSPINVTNLPGYIPNQLKTPKTDHSTKFSDTNNSSSDSNVNDLKTTEHPVSDRFSTASNKELTTEASKNNKPQGNSYVLAIIGGVVAFLLVVAVIAVFIYTRKHVKNGPTRFKRPLFYLFDGEQKKNPPISSLGNASAGRNGISIREDLQVTGTVMSIACSQDTEYQGHYEIYESVDFQDNKGGDNTSSNFGSSSDRLYAKIKRVRESITKF